MQKPLLTTVKPYARQRGTILITVMLLFAIGAYMATEITYRQRVDIQRTSSIFANAQAYEYVLGAEEIARFALREDLKKDSDRNDPNDFKDKEDWGQQLLYPVEGGTLEGELHDLQARFNINWLLDTDTDRRNYYKQALVTLMQQLKIPKEKPASAVADQIIDYLDENSTPIYPDGKDEQELMLEEPPRRAANRLMVDVSELNLIPALTPEEVEILAPFVAVLPFQTGLNFNNAAEEVLSSFECLDASAIVNGRGPEGYRDVGDAEIYQQTPDCQNANRVLTPVIRSEYYELEATAVINGKTVKVRSVLYRDNEQSSNIDAKVIYRRQVDPYSKV